MPGIPSPAGPRRQLVEQIGVVVHAAARPPDHAGAHRSAEAAPRPSRSDRPSGHPADDALAVCSRYSLQDRVCLRPLRQVSPHRQSHSWRAPHTGKRLPAADRHPPLWSTVSISAFAVFRLTAMSSAISEAKRSVTGSPKRGPSARRRACWPDPPLPAGATRRFSPPSSRRACQKPPHRGKRSGWSFVTEKLERDPGASGGRYDAFSLRRSRLWHLRVKVFSAVFDGAE
jgi:hypothetical protein